MKFENIIQTLIRNASLDDNNGSDLIKQLFELQASLTDKELNNSLLHKLVGKYALAERQLKSANQQLFYKNEEIEKTLAEKNYALECLDKELSEAADYIRKILPKPIIEGDIRIDWRFLPCSSLGGDAFGYHWLDEDHFVVYLIDASGHGVGPALLSVSVINALRSQSLPHTDFKKPEIVLDSLNKAFPSQDNNGMFFTIWYGIYNKNSRELNFSSGGHPPALLLDNSDEQNVEIKQLRTPNLIVGALEDVTFINETLQIPKNSKLYIYSDGAYEIKIADEKMWQIDEFIQFISDLENIKVLTIDHLIEETKSIGFSDVFEDDYTILEISFD